MAADRTEKRRRRRNGFVDILNGFLTLIVLVSLLLVWLGGLQQVDQDPAEQEGEHQHQAEGFLAVFVQRFFQLEPRQREQGQHADDQRQWHKHLRANRCGEHQ